MARSEVPHNQAKTCRHRRRRSQHPRHWGSELRRETETRNIAGGRTSKKEREKERAKDKRARTAGDRRAVLNNRRKGGAGPREKQGSATPKRGALPPEDKDRETPPGDHALNTESADQRPGGEGRGGRDATAPVHLYTHLQSPPQGSTTDHYRPLWKTRIRDNRAITQETRQHSGCATRI